MKEYEFEVEFTTTMTFTIEADSLEEAVEKLEDEAREENLGSGAHCDLIEAVYTETGEKYFFA